MRTLDEAWAWYTGVKRQIELMRRLADRYWPDLPWETSALGGDPRFNLLEGIELVEEADRCARHLDDLAVLVLFSVFEAVVRERMNAAIAPEVARIELRH